MKKIAKKFAELKNMPTFASRKRLKFADVAQLARARDL